MLIRNNYISKIISLLWQNIIKILIGQRRVGKSTILKQLRKQIGIDTTIIYEFDMVDQVFTDYQQWHQHIISQITQSTKAILVDEIQILSWWEKVITSLHKSHPYIDLIITGSNSTMLSSELSTLLSGRYIAIPIYPFSYSEFCEFRWFDRSSDSFEEYMIEWWLPSVYQITDNQYKKEWINSLIDTIVIKDIVQRHNIRDVALLYDIVRYISQNISNITNINNIRKELSLKWNSTWYNTVSSITWYLKDVFMIYECPLYDIQGKWQFDRLKKFYLSDHSMRSSMISGYDTGKSKELENIIYIECLRQWWSVYTGRIWDQEIDFVCEKNGIKKYIQVCYILSDEQVIKREFWNFDTITDHREKYVISMDRSPFGTINGVKHVQMRNMNQLWS
jgi:uncharacterized protein